MPIPHRNNPLITSNWTLEEPERRSEDGELDPPFRSKLVRRKTAKNAYYDIKLNEDQLQIKLREEKKRLGGSAEQEEHWYSYLYFPVESQFAKDLKMFVNEYIEEEAEEATDIIRLYREKCRHNNEWVQCWAAQIGDQKVTAFTKGNALIKLAVKIEGNWLNKIFGFLKGLIEK